MTRDEEKTTEEEPQAEQLPAAEPAQPAAPAETPAQPVEAGGQATAQREAAPAGARPAGGSRPERPRGRPGDRGERGGRRHFGRRKVCAFCVEKATSIDYKDPGKLRRYISDRGRIEGRRRTGTCAKHQRWLALALKRARHLALLPYCPEHIRVTGMFAPRR